MANLVRDRKPHKLLSIYQGDIFGREEIGKIKEYNLKYIVDKSCKLLILS